MTPAGSRRSPKKSAAGFVAVPEGLHSIGFAGDGYCFDNEGPAHQVYLRPVRHRARARHQCAMARFHRRRRLRDAVAVALGRLGDGAGGRLGGARLLAQGRRPVAHAHARRPAAGRSRRAGLPRELLRSRRVRALDGQGPADRTGVGGRGARRPDRRRLRHRLAMDAQRLFALSGLSRRHRRARRVQRQVHDQPDGAARLVACDARGPFPGKLSQFLLSAGALAVQRAAACPTTAR